jgi:deoxyadenosine/deoxycytidine kinase
MNSQLRVEICGGIGVGKSTLARRLASKLPHCVLVEENFSGNPLWRAFYSAPARFVREKNISFLAQHFAELKIPEAPTVVADFSTLQDLAYAIAVQDREHERVMALIHEHLLGQFSPRRIIVHLSSSLEKQLDNIAGRSRVEELMLTRPMLAILNDALEVVLNRVDSELQMIDIDATSLDLRTDPDVIQGILRKLPKVTPDA